jgi:hypothetical protein
MEGNVDDRAALGSLAIDRDRQRLRVLGWIDPDLKLSHSSHSHRSQVSQSVGVGVGR